MNQFVSISEELLAASVILIVDDDPVNSAVVDSLLSGLYQTVVTHSGESALDFCQKTLPDLILLDVVMGGISGLETCRKLKQNVETQHIPVVFITSILDVEGEINCWDAGCVDFVTKPVNGVTLLNRIKSHLVSKLQADMLRRMSYKDGLTGLNNRHVLDEVLEKSMLYATRSDHPLSVMMLDVDWFKLYNDYYGHLQGDDCLRQIADSIKEVVQRPTDVAIRFGGEEFLCVLPETDLAGVEHLAQALLKSVLDLKIPHAKSPLNIVTVSVGIFTFKPKSTLSQRRYLSRQIKPYTRPSNLAGINIILSPMSCNELRLVCAPIVEYAIKPIGAR
ncbi:diguanylate cyclase [Paraglaciecola aquimarina]|uniref:diguanylate cyclase n=1 Tax=Paraglaciecola aquimarina TaxID=1235557 RepID=A0ABU3ST96_9ALTE|nr:diguanylate cyclase [Paraglaciecola aquimarina]MDU0353220.1 diguanylate cyclase [Paraglaciecola aquimarina]